MGYKPVPPELNLRPTIPAPATPNGLYNDIAPHHELRREQPWHRVAINMARRGFSNQIISVKLGKSPVAISNLLRQPWARDYIVNKMEDDIQTEVANMFKGAVKVAAGNILTALQSEDEAVRMRASVNVVERVCGKATQPIREEKVEPEKMTDDELERRIAVAAGN